MSLGSIYEQGNGEKLHVDPRELELTPEQPFAVVDPTPEQLKAAQRLRAQIYAREMGFIEPSQVDPLEGIESDEYDKAARHFVAVDAEGVVGNIRMIGKESSASLLPSEHSFGLKAPEGSVEASRFVVRVDRRARNSELLVSIALIREFVKESLNREAPYIYMTIEDDLRKHLQEIGIPLEQISEPRFLKEFNSLNAAYRVRPNDILPGIWEADTKFYADDDGVLRTRPIKAAPFFARSFIEGESGRFGLGDLGPDQRLFERNLGFLTEQEQKQLMNSTVSIAGTGGDGGMLALQLARLGVGRFKLADPENFEAENLNRQAASSYRVLGKNKAEVVAKAVLDINPFAQVEVYNRGVEPENIEKFITDADLVIDETEFTTHEIGVMIAREARKQEKPVLMALNVGFGCYVTSFGPEGYTFEEMMGLAPDAQLEEVATSEVPLERWVGHVPSYADIETLERVAHEEMPAPSVAPGVALAAGVAATEAVWHLLGSENRPAPTLAPHCLSFDAVDGFELVKDTPEGFRRSLGRLAAKAAGLELESPDQS